jgi:competence protein ComEC
VQFEVLYPSPQIYADAMLKDNNRSCVLKITSQAGSILLTGDIEKQAERDLLSSNAESAQKKLKSDVIIVPHHGSKTSSTMDFVAAVKPSISIFTTGYLNRFGHPKSEVFARYQAEHSMMYRSDYHGALEINFNNNLIEQDKIKVASWRNQNKRYWHDIFTAEIVAVE